LELAQTLDPHEASEAFGIESRVDQTVRALVCTHPDQQSVMKARRKST